MKIAVIGGGASGMAAAAAAARAGGEVFLFEKEDRVGRKLLATGNGKCNYSNAKLEGRFYRSSDPGFVNSVLDAVGQAETLDFFRDMGIWPRTDAEGRIYPSSEQASAVLNVLRMEMRRVGVQIFCGEPVKEIRAKKDGTFLIGTKQGHAFRADRVIIASGGMAGSQYGCSGDGYRLAEALGHHCVPPRPALVQLTVQAGFLKQIKGVRVKGKAALVCLGEILEEETGEIQFTEFGLSGICIFNLSGPAMRRMAEGQPCLIRLDLFPQMDPDGFRRMMKQRLALSGHKTAEEFPEGLIHKKLIPVVLKQCGVENMAMPAAQMTQEQCMAAAKLLKGWSFPVTGARPWSEAQTTSGGVTLSELDPDRMESRLCPGVFFTGEVVDVDGKCGGYNLQWAWSTGILAGRCAACGESGGRKKKQD